LYWIHIIQGRDPLRAVMITVMDRLHKIWRIFWPGELCGLREGTLRLYEYADMVAVEVKIKSHW